MQIHYSFDNLHIRNAVVTTGSFDGVHVGHKVIIDRLKEIAHNIHGETVLITFFPHPRKVLYPETAGKELQLINSQKEKMELLRKAGLDHLIIIEFTREFAQITSKVFVEDILLNKIHAKCIVVGFNHHFGHNREGDYQYLDHFKDRYHFGVEEIPEQDIQNETVSSTKIRKALREGKIQRANAYLDHQYIISGLINRCNGFAPDKDETWEIILEEDTKLIPMDGIYAVSIKNNDRSEKAMLIVNRNVKRKVTFSFVGEQFCAENEDVTIYFQKEIVTEIDFKDQADFEGKLNYSKKLIEELIF